MKDEKPKQIKSYQSPITGYELTIIKTGLLEWTSLDSCDKIPLTDTERSRTINIGYDLKKLTKIKRFFLQGFNKSKISKEAGISLSTVKRYIPLLDKETTELREKKYQKSYKKAIKKPTTTNNGSYNLLFISVLDTNEPLLLIYLLLPLFILVSIFFYKKYKSYLEDKKSWMIERGKYHKIFLDVLDFKYNKEVIVVRSPYEKAYYKKILIHYKNGSREVAYIAQKNGESYIQYFERIEYHERIRDAENCNKIKKGRAAKNKATQNMDEKNLRDYLLLGSYKKRNWLESKIFIASYCEYYIQNPKPTKIDKIPNI